MALGIKYSGTFYNINDQAVKVDILTEGYASTVYPLRIQSIKISQEWNDYHTATMGQGCELVLVNIDSDWNFFEELMICEEQEFLLRVTFVSTVVFEGWVLTDIQEQQILDYAIINIKAANYLAQLTEVKTCTCVEGAAVWTLIDYIRSILTKTGILNNIHVNCSLYETSMTNERLMTDLYLHKHLFFEGEERDSKLKYMNLLDMLNMLLKSYNIYVYAWDQAWYVERYQDLFSEDSVGNNRSYVQYNISTGAIVSSYEVSEPILSAQNDFKYTDTSQTLQYGKGYKAINVNCVSHKDHNLVNESFADAVSHFFYDPIPFNAIEKWYYGVGSYYGKGGAIDYGEDWVQYLNPEIISTSLYSGLGAKFLVRGNKSGEGSVRVNFRRQLTEEELKIVLNDSTSGWTWDTDYVYGVYIGFRIVLMFYDPERGDYQCYYWDNKNQEWKVNDGYSWTSALTASMYWMGGGEGKWLTAYKYDKEGDYYYWEFDQTFPFSPDTCANHDIFKEETVWELRLLPCRFYFDYAGPGGPDGTNTIDIRNPLFRKIRVTATDNEDDEDLEVTGEIDVNRFSELDTDLDIYDHTDHGAANTAWVNTAILPLEGTYTPIYPSAWLDKRTRIESPLRIIPLQEHFLEDIFQFYNRPRKKLVTSIRYDDVIPPFSFIRDLHIERDASTIDLLLLSYVWDLNSMIYEIEAEEYVTDEGYRLVDGEMVSPSPNPDGSSGAESSDAEYTELTGASFTNYNLPHSGGFISLDYGYIQYYNGILVEYRLVLMCVYGVPNSVTINILSDTAMPAVGNNTYGYMIINQNRSTEGVPISYFDSPDGDEQIYCFYLTAPGKVWKVTPLTEFYKYETEGEYEFLTDYAYSCLIEGVANIGE
jgi:hypothetical protein